MLYCAPCHFPYSRKPDVSSKMSDNQQNELWGGRFSESTDAFVQAFTASVGFDRRMYRQDIRGSIAHATMLAQVGVLSGEDRDLIVNGLPKLKEVLSQLGMEVASVNVNVRQEGQSGGNPTPGKPSSGMAGVAAKRGTGEADASGDLPPERSVKPSNDGLDLLV